MAPSWPGSPGSIRRCPGTAPNYASAELSDGIVDSWRTLVGSVTESVLQPEWTDNASLTAISDRSGWWNLVRVALDGTVTPLHPDEAEYGGPLWSLGTRWYDELDDGRMLAVRSLGADGLITHRPAHRRAPNRSRRR